MSHPSFPSSPWHLEGEVYISLWIANARDIPGPLRPFRFFGKVIVATVYAHYLPGGDLSYHELAFVVPVWRRGPAVTVPLIWVDSPVSRDGGRELWDVPKELATFLPDRSVPGVVQLNVGAVKRRFGRTRSRMPVVQPNGSALLEIMGPTETVRATWWFPDGSPLSFLRRPLLTLRKSPADIIFR